MAALLKQACMPYRRIFCSRISVLTQSHNVRSFALDSHVKEPSTTNEEAQDAPKEPHEIYSGPLTKQVHGIKMFSLATSLMALGLQPVIYQQVSTTGGSLPPMLAFASGVAVFSFFTPFLIHYVTKKYVIDIVYDPTKEEYTASVFNVIPTKRKISFKLEDVSVPDVPGAFTTMHIRDMPVLCLSSSFSYPEHYIKFMGYDKPVDLRAGSVKETKSSDDSSDKKSL